MAYMRCSMWFAPIMGCGEGDLKRSGVDPPLSSSRACLHTAFIAFADGGGGCVGDAQRKAAARPVL